MKVVLIVAAVAVLIVGVLLTLRTSRNAGMPSADVLRRAAERERARAADDEHEDD